MYICLELPPTQSRESSHHPKMSLTAPVSVKFSFQAPGKHHFTGNHHTLISHFQSPENEKVMYATSCCLAYFTEENVLILFKQILKKNFFFLERTFVFYEDWSDFYFAKLLLPLVIHLRDFFVLFCFYSGQNIHCLGWNIRYQYVFSFFYENAYIYMYTYVFINEVYS